MTDAGCRRVPLYRSTLRAHAFGVKGAPAPRKSREITSDDSARCLRRRLLGQWREHSSRGQRGNNPAQRGCTPVSRRDSPALR